MILSSTTAFWQVVCLSGTASLEFFPFLFFDTEFDCKSGVPSLFLFLPVLSTVFELCALPLRLIFGAMSAGAEKVVGSGGFGLSPLGCKLYR